MKYSIGVIVCYFGCFPPYFNLWLKSCERNNDIDFLIYTNCSYTDYLPKNVKIINTTLLNIKKRTEEVVGFDIVLNRAYKLCDLRPLFGKIFENDLKDYDFWGYCDLDVIFGDIRKFITDDILEKYDKVNRWGHLSLHRNNKDCNERYKLESTRYSYEQVLSNTRDFGFDEYDYTHIFEKYNFPLYYLPDDCYADIRARYKRFCKQGDGNQIAQVFYWEDGRVFREYFDDGSLKKEEYLYIHFKKRGPLSIRMDTNKLSLIHAFYITNSGFYEKAEPVDMNIINQYNPYPGKLHEQIENIGYKLNELFVRIKRKYYS